MIHPDLHKKPAVLDRVQHRELRLKRDVPPIRAAAGLNSLFITTAEFGDACKEYPIVFLRAGSDAVGKQQIAPIVVTGLAQGENLLLDGDQWHLRYVPAMLRAYPFTMGRIADEQYAVCFDQSWQGLSTTEGEPLFGADGEPAELLKQLQGFVEAIETEIERTRQFGQQLVDRALLKDMRFDATLPDGQKLSVDGFLTVDEEKLKALPDADVIAMHRNGVLELLQAHRISMSNMRRLVELSFAQRATA